MARIVGWTESERKQLPGINGPHIQLGQTIFSSYASAPQQLVENNLMLVCDGYFYNCPEEYSNPLLWLHFLYREYGFEGMLQKINGDFAIALYDEENQITYLARDRVGLKPLYHTTIANTLAFASQPDVLLNFPGVDCRLNTSFVSRFAASHYRLIDNERENSPYAAISQLPAATYLQFKSGKSTVKTYWQLNNFNNLEGDENLLAEQYKELLLEAVNCRMKVASKPAFTLSGGMDSSSVLASAVYLSGNKQQAFSTVYEDKTFDESDEIETILKDTVEKWHPVTISSPDVLGLVKEMVALHGEPVATATWLSHHLLCKEVSNRGFKSLFGGLGGDELNAGEYEHFFYNFADIAYEGDTKRWDKELSFWSKYHDHPLYKKNKRTLQETLNRVVDPTISGKCLVDRERMMRYSSALNKDYFDLPSYQPLMSSPSSSYLKNRTFQDIFWETAPCCLRAEDRQCSASGLDNFLPFYDYRLLEFMFRIPGHLKIRDGVTKYLLRQAMKDILPEETRGRIKKTGWNAPAHVWFSGKGLEPLKDMIHSQKFRQRGIYDVGEVESLLQEHDDIISNNQLKENHMMFFWQLINLELWCEHLEAQHSLAL